MCIVHNYGGIMKIIVSGLFNFNSEVNGDKKDYTENVDIVFQKSENNESVFSGAVGSYPVCRPQHGVPVCHPQGQEHCHKSL